jgi:hypothetical protein
MDELVAGKALDTLVAEEVMGWAVNRSETHWHTVGVIPRRLIGRDCCAYKYDGGEFCPSTKIESAWEVVQK